MSAFITDDAPKQIAIDLSTTDALVIRAGLRCRLLKIWLSGTVNGNGTIVLRSDAADGTVVWTAEANTSALTRFAFDVDFPSAGAPSGKESAVISGKGLFLDALGAAWEAGSTLILYLDALKSFGNFGE